MVKASIIVATGLFISGCAFAFPVAYLATEVFGSLVVLAIEDGVTERPSE